MKSGTYYSAWPPFRDDMKRMFENAMAYNTEGSQVHTDAAELLNLFRSFGPDDDVEEPQAAAAGAPPPSADSSDSRMAKGRTWN